MDWYPTKPTWWQIITGIVFWLTVAAVLLYWSTDESGGNRILLWVLAGVAVVMAAWRLRFGVALGRQNQMEKRLRS